MRSLRAVAMHRSALAVGAAAVLLGAGCSGAAPGAVAYVGNTKISQEQLDEAVAGVSTTVEEGQQVSPDAVANALIHGVLAEQIARDQKITITDGDRDALLKDSNLAPLLTVPAAKPIAYDVADQQLVARKLGAEAFLAEIRKRTVTLNPRFGVLDPQQQTIVTNQSGSLSKPATAQTP